jgi:3-hydroxyisobutyrate dehydrogenase-like beta-hydroxyacid dehydrogenase
LADFGIDYVDAPVSGGRAGAIRGTVTVMWSGSAERMELIRPVLDSFAGSVFFVGPTPGQGQAMKLLNNYLSAVAMTATSEAIVFGLSHSLDMKTMLDVANVSTGQNSATQDKFPNRILTSTYDAGFRMALMDKDVALYLSEAKSAGTPASLCEQVATYWQKGMKQFPDGDFTEIFKVIRGEID